jgi:hypothetical protein
MTRTRQPDRSPYSDGFHTMAVDWEAGKITSEWVSPCWIALLAVAHLLRLYCQAGACRWW